MEEKLNRKKNSGKDKALTYKNKEYEARGINLQIKRMNLMTQISERSHPKKVIQEEHDLSQVEEDEAYFIRLNVIFVEN